MDWLPAKNQIHVTFLAISSKAFFFLDRGCILRKDVQFIQSILGHKLYIACWRVSIVVRLSLSRNNQGTATELGGLMLSNKMKLS